MVSSVYVGKKMTCMYVMYVIVNTVPLIDKLHIAHLIDQVVTAETTEKILLRQQYLNTI